ncbi:MAG: cyclophilin-like fold protein [Acetatifactor muris]|nr:cyclophilin-like fold protein [Acetatifactor muris]
MKKNKLKTWAAIFTLGVSILAGCGAEPEDPGEPPAEVINGESTNAENNSVQVESGTNMEETDSGDVSGDEVLANAISVRIGRDGSTEWNVDMYNNDAALTMLDYLSGSALLFPTYTYDEEGGFVAQSIRGSYTRDDEQTIADVKAGELYLFSGGQLRFYFKDIEGADITATPVGCFTDIEGLAEAVQEAYTSNLDDTWGVDVYFWITKTLE